MSARTLSRTAARLLLENPHVGSLAHHTFGVAVSAYLAHLRVSQNPIVVGPWTGEVGHELLYWIPFLTKLVETGVLEPARTFAVSRGNNRAWYGRVTHNYYNLFNQIPVERYTEAVAGRTGLEKRLYIDRLDREALKHAADHFGHTHYGLLHPMLLDNWFLPVWKARLSSQLAEKHLAFRPFSVADVGPSWLESNSQKQYVAVKFWFNANFPDTPQNVRFIGTIVERLASRYAVLLLRPPKSIDGHAHADPTRQPNVVDCAPFISLGDNLMMQTILMRRAAYYVGTFGGMSLLPAFLAKTCFAFHSEPFDTPHLELARSMWAELAPGGYRVRHVRQFSLDELP